MANRVRRTSSLAVRPPKRAMRWLGSTLRTGVQTVVAGGIVLDQSFAQAAITVVGDFTITRIRGILSVASDQVTLDEQPFGALGVMVVREAARAIGVTALVRPYDEAFDSGWMLHQYWRVSCHVSGSPTQEGSLIGSTWFTHYELDIKSMRKVQSSDAIVVVIENASSSHGAQYLLDFRMLVKIQ